MRAFATLLERLAFTPARNGKLALIREYLRTVSDPERGYALAALTGDLALRTVTPSLLRAMVTERLDEELFALSYDFVGDLAETIALAWPTDAPPQDIGLPEVVDTLRRAPKTDLPRLIGGWLDALPPSERYALLKLATGGLRVGVSGRLARTALAAFGGVDVTEIEELWHGLTPPYEDLFVWLEGGEKPVQAGLAPFRPVMLSTPTDLDSLQSLDPAAYAAEWKWDGIRVQAVSDQGVRRLYSRTGEDISGAFPDLMDTLDFDGTLDGELLVRRGGSVAPFGDLQKRLNRKSVSKALLASHPAALRAYDLLIWQGEDLRDLPFDQRRARLDQVPTGPRLDISPLLDFASWDQLAALRGDPPAPEIEGVMIKRRDSTYLAGRKRGPWFKWKRDPMVVDAVLIYAQRGHGKRSGFYSDYTFGVWDGDTLVPVGKAYFGFTDDELRKLDKFIRANTIDRFGPVRSVKPELVFEVAFEGLNRSSRHKSGLAMRFPRISRIRWDKPACEADTLPALQAMLPTD